MASKNSCLRKLSFSKQPKDEWTKYDERLIDAAYKSDREKIKETIRKKGVSPVKVSRDGQTALHISVKKGMNECVDYMLAEQPDLSTIDLQGRTVYHIAASKGDPTMLKKLLDYSRWNLELKDTKEMTALHYAVASGENECVKLLMQNNAPVDSRDGEGRTALLTAIVNGYEKIAMALILHGVDVNAADYKERTPIIMACIQGMRDVVALLISKGADSKIVDAEGKTLEMVAADAGHNDIVDILRNSADSGIMDIEHIHDHEDNVIVEEGGEEQEEVKMREQKIIEAEENKHDVQKLERTRSNRRSILKSDESSLTSSIIESLMGYEVNTDSISQTSSEAKEKLELDKQEMVYQISQRDIRIEELEQELSTLRKKLRWETEMRFQAESEVLGLKNHIENIEEIRTVSFNEDRIEEEDEEEEQEEIDEDEHENGQASEENQSENNDEIEGDAEDEKEAEDEEEQVEEKDTEEVKPVEQEVEHENEAANHHNDRAYDTDDSINWETGYRKKSLGTAKQHIDMLEEHILGLEEDIVHKDQDIFDLESKLKSARELVDLNNNTTVSLEAFNKYKAEKKTERNTYKEQIRTLENELQDLQTNLRVAETLKANFETDTEVKNNMINELKKESDDLQSKISEHKTNYQKDISCYRENLLALYQNQIDDKLEEALKKIVKLRSL